MKLKQALVKDGFLTEAEAGRGRPSRAMVERGKELVAQGWTIDGLSVETATEGSDTPKVVRAVKAELPNVGDPIRSEAEWDAYVMVDGKRKEVGMRTVCNLCKNSLTYCYDRSPVIWLDHETSGVVNFRLLSSL